MSTHLRPSRRWLSVLALVLLGLIGGLSWTSPALAAGDYSVSLLAPDLSIQFEDVKLTAEVKDSQGQPVNGVPVTFQVPPHCKQDTTLEPIQTLTHDGTASTAFQADMPGIVTVTVQAGNTTQTAHITVSGNGSRVYDKQP